MRNSILALSTSMSLLALAPALPVHADEPLKLASTYKESTVRRFKSTLKVSVNGTEVTSIQTREEKVKSVKDNGAVTLLENIVKQSIDMGNGPQEAPSSGHPVTVVLDKSGRLDDFIVNPMDETIFAPPVMRLVYLVNHASLPDKPVKPDDTWETELDNPAVKGKKVKIKDTFKGLEKKDGTSLWKIVQTLEAVSAEDGSKMSSESTFLLDPADGRLVTEEDTVKGVLSRYGLLDWKSKTELLKADAETVAADGVKKPDADSKPDADKKSDPDAKPGGDKKPTR